jgi:hypothetical protein
VKPPYELLYCGSIQAYTIPQLDEFLKQNLTPDSLLSVISAAAPGQGVRQIITFFILKRKENHYNDHP